MLKRVFVLIVACFLLSFHPGETEAASKTVRLLTVGNSFANNALTYLPSIAEAAGQKLVVEKANLGGCTLERHWRHVTQHEADADDPEGSPYQNGKYSLEDLLAKDDWDFITLQQVSFQSHDLDTFYPYARDLHRFILQRSPKSRILAHQTWAYRMDDPRFIPANQGKEPHTREIMYHQVRLSYRSLARDLNIGLLPSGDAMFLADTNPQWGFQPDDQFVPESASPPELPPQRHSLHRGWYWDEEEDGPHLKMDSHHASDAGKYLLGCVWFEVLYELDVQDNPFVPEGLESAYAAFLRETAHQAVARSKSSG